MRLEEEWNVTEQAGNAIDFFQGVSAGTPDILTQIFHGFP
jgi:hypothetical protein